MLEDYQKKELMGGAYGLAKGKVPLSAYTTFQIGGPCDLLIEPTAEKELVRLVRYLRAEGIPYYVFGRGSNILVRDGGLDGVAVVLGSKYSDCWIDNDLVTTEAGATIPDIALLTFEAGLTGMEEISGIPGTVGGGAIMNAGAYGREMKDILESVRAINQEGEIVTLRTEDMDMRYRSSRMMREGMLISQVSFRLQAGDREEILKKYEDFRKRRASKQPLDKASAGSTFKRPQGGYASALIDQAGLRGFRYGEAQVSDKHCGFLINRGKATAKELLTLIALVQEKVKDQFDIDLEPEVRIIGKDD